MAVRAHRRSGLARGCGLVGGIQGDFAFEAGIIGGNILDIAIAHAGGHGRHHRVAAFAGLVRLERLDQVGLVLSGEGGAGEAGADTRVAVAAGASSVLFLPAAASPGCAGAARAPTNVRGEWGL